MTFRSLIQMVSCPEIVAGLFLNASAISLGIGESTVFQFVFSAFRLVSYRTDLYLLI